MSDFFRTISLKTRVLSLMAMLLVAGIWGLAARTAVVLQGDIEKLLSEQMSATVAYVATDIDSKIQERIDTLNGIAQSITPALLADPAMLNDHLRRHYSSRAIFPVGIFVINGKATVIADSPVIEGRIGGSIKDRDFVFIAMATGKPTIGSPVIGRFAKKSLFTLAVPLRDASGKSAGALLGSLYPSDPTLFGRLEETTTGKTVSFLVISPKDHLIVSATDKSRIMQPLPAKGVNALLDQRVEQGFEGAGVTTNSLGVENLSVSRNMKTTGWFVLAAVSTEEAFAPIVTLKRQIYLAALLMTLVMIAVLRLALARQLAPLEEAGAAMRRMTDGLEPLAPLPVLREDEIGRLVGNFNQLATERLRLDELLRTEIAERQSAEATLKENQEMMRSTFEYAAVGIAHIATDTFRILAANDRFCILLGYARDELIGSDSRMLTPADEMSARDNERAQVIAGRIQSSSIERQLIRKDGTLLWVNRSLSLVRDAAGEPRYFISVIEDISARKQAEEARARLAAVAESSNDAIFIRNAERRIVYWNDGAARMYGYTSDEVMGRESDFLVPPELLEERRRNWAALQQGMSVANFETVRIRKDGVRLDVSVSLSPVRGQNGTMIGIATIARDITGRKQTDAIRAFLAAIVNSSYDAIVSRDLEDKILTWNAGAERLFGYTADEAIGRSISMIFPPDRTDEIARNRVLLAQGRAILDLETVRLAKGGRRIDVSLSQSTINDERGVAVGVALIFRDISERVRKIALIQLLESLARATNEAATPEMAIRACLNHICIYGDWTLGHVALYAPGCSSGIASSSFWRCEDAARFAEFMRLSDEFSHNRPEGQFVGVAMRERRAVWVEDLLQKQHFGRLGSAGRLGIRAGFVFPLVIGGEIAGFLEFFATETRAPDLDLLAAINSIASQLARLMERGRAADELARVNAQLEMRVADRTIELETANKELNSFSYTIAHDMRAPVRAINGFSELVLKANEGKLDPTSVGYLKRVVAGSRHMGELIDDLLNLARLSRQEMRRRNFNLSELAASVVAALAEPYPECKVAITIQADMIADGDPGLLRAALDNLIGNALKYSAKIISPHIEIGAGRRDGRTVYHVRDNGVGFDMQYSHKLFAPFQRLHHASEFEGTGIGLATVKKIIHRHGGEVWIESAVNQGTTVFFTLGAAG